ncbi:MAG: dephospho-CoA kinase, partial [Oscillospiraceae bacterium]|nr:dephospho-CoA kinase [Oscillospiraceae bacterium]
YAAIDAIKLSESGLAALCDVTVAITAPEETRVRRIMARDGIDEARARARVRAQKDETFYRARCERVFVNDYPTRDAADAAAGEFVYHLLRDSKEES